VEKLFVIVLTGKLHHSQRQRCRCTANSGFELKVRARTIIMPLANSPVKKICKLFSHAEYAFSAAACVALLALFLMVAAKPIVTALDCCSGMCQTYATCVAPISADPSFPRKRESSAFHLMLSGSPLSRATGGNTMPYLRPYLTYPLPTAKDNMLIEPSSTPSTNIESASSSRCNAIVYRRGR
jgi:hypothetical protein